MKNSKQAFEESSGAGKQKDAFDGIRKIICEKSDKLNRNNKEPRKFWSLRAEMASPSERIGQREEPVN